MRKIRAYLLLLLLFLAVSSASAGVTKIEATVDSTAITIEDAVTFAIVIHNLDTNLIDFPQNTADYNVTATSSSKSFRLINGQSDKSVTYKYVLKPKHTGTMTVPSATVRAGPIKHTTNPIDIQVSPAQAKKPVPQLPKPRTSPNNSAPPSKPIIKSEKQIFSRFELSNLAPYPNEQVSLKLKIFHRGNLRTLHLEPLQLDDFIVERDDKAREYQEVVGGAQYYVYEISFVIFPVKPGETVIPATSIETVVLEDRDKVQLDPFRFMNPFLVERKRTLTTPEVTLKVQSFPPGAPKEFTGYVGELAVVHDLKQESVLSGEAVSLETKINGDGNLATLVPDLVEESKLYSLFSDKESSVSEIENHRRYFEASKTTAIIPRKDKGKISIKTKPLISFNPKTRKYEVHGKARFELDVLSNPNLNIASGQTLQGKPKPVKELNETILSIPGNLILSYEKQPVRNRDLILAIILINLIAFLAKAWRYLQGLTLPEQENGQSIGAYIKQVKAADKVSDISKLLREVSLRTKRNQELEAKLGKFFEESDRVNYSMPGGADSGEQLEYFRKQALQLMKELAHAK